MFGRKNKKNHEKEAEFPSTESVEAENSATNEKTVEQAVSPTETEEESGTSYVEFDRANGPWDIEEQDTAEGYIDFGSMRIKMLDGLNMRLDVEQKTQRMISVTLTKDNSSLQVQAFAAPRTTGIWDEIRLEIAESVRKQGGKIQVRNGALGRDIISRLPAKTPDGRNGFRVARFVGVDGPRWFLRGVFSGDAALKPDQASEMEEIFRSIVVVRGEDPRPPRDLLDMVVPKSIREAQERQRDEEKKQAAEKANAKLEMPRRGPEIAEIR